MLLAAAARLRVAAPFACLLPDLATVGRAGGGAAAALRRLHPSPAPPPPSALAAAARTLWTSRPALADSSGSSVTSRRYSERKLIGCDLEEREKGAEEHNAHTSFLISHLPPPLFHDCRQLHARPNLQRRRGRGLVRRLCALVRAQQGVGGRRGRGDRGSTTTTTTTAAAPAGRRRDDDARGRAGGRLPRLLGAVHVCRHPAARRAAWRQRHR